MTRTGVSVVIVFVMLAGISLPACAAEKPQQGSQDQRSVASAINSSPNDTSLRWSRFSPYVRLGAARPASTGFAFST